MYNSARLLLVGATAAVAACGGGTSSSNTTPPSTTAPTIPPTMAPTIPPTTDPTIPPAQSYSYVGTAISSGETLVARGSVGIELTYQGGPTALVNPPEVKVRRSANGELEFDLNGVRHTFDVTDRRYGNGYTVDPDPNIAGDEYSLFIRTGTIDGLLEPGGNWHEVVMTQSTLVNNGSPALRAFGVIGAPTAGIDLPKVGTATYSGNAWADIYPAAGYVNNFTSRTELRSRLGMSVDFGNTKISGALSNIEERYPSGEFGKPGPWVQVNGAWRMTETDVNVNGFTGKIAPDGYDGALTLNDASSYSGAFYGPAADEVGGTLSLTGTSIEPGIDGGNFNGIGFFTGIKD